MFRFNVRQKCFGFLMASGVKLVGYCGSLDCFRPLASYVSALSSIVAKGLQVLPTSAPSPHRLRSREGPVVLHRAHSSPHNIRPGERVKPGDLRALQMMDRVLARLGWFFNSSLGPKGESSQSSLGKFQRRLAERRVPGD